MENTTVRASFKDGSAFSSSTVRGDKAGAATKAAAKATATAVVGTACTVLSKAAYGAGYAHGFVASYIRALRS